MSSIVNFPFMHSCQKKSKFRKLFFPLDSTGADHLLSEVVLVLGDGAVPCADSLVLTNKNLLGNLVEQSACR
jgi:hypothetical protein